MNQEESERSQKNQAARLQTLKKVADYCHYWLNYDKPALQYLRQTRKLTDETIKRFRIGAFPGVKQLLGRFSQYELQHAGLLKQDETTGELVSKFSHNKLILPIEDLYGRTAALMGRTLLSAEDQERLLINKYDGTVFAKSRLLYGLNLARESVREKNAVLVVEGQFDVISAHQAGVKNVVASSGAFLHPNQVALLARYAERIVLGLDADEAGQKAIARVLRRGAVGVRFDVKQVPAGCKDWDEYFRGKTGK